jgi:hypothetical protein
MKGVGVYNPTHDAKYRDPVYHIASPEPFQPTNVPLVSFASYPHFGINSSGEYTFAFGKMAPTGAIVHQRALNEYNCALHMLKHNVPAIVPLAVVKYNDLPRFEEQDLGAVVCLSPSRYPHRLGEVQHGAALRPGIDKSKDEYYHLLLDAFEIDADPYTEITRLRLLKKLSRKVAGVINKFSTCGLFRYSSTLQNFEFDFRSKEVVLTDLDSTLFLNSLPPHLQRLQVIRDLASIIYHVMVGFATPLALGHYTLKNLITHDPIEEIISGYFSVETNQQIKNISSLLWSLFVPHFVLLNRHKQKIDTEWSVERRRSYKMEHDLLYVMAITCLYPLFSKSRIGSRYPHDTLTQEVLFNKAKKYLGNRYEYFEYLLSRNNPVF